jgi:hypothetical protein
MAFLAICSVCGFIIVKGKCLHTVKGYSADEWREAVRLYGKQMPPRKKKRRRVD